MNRQKRNIRIGILGFQGGVREHEETLSRIGVGSWQVKTQKDLNSCDGLIIPGGESTTIGFFLKQSGLDHRIIERAKKGLPIWGTCAGAILLAKKINSEPIPPALGLLDITIARNAYGSQHESFQAKVDIPAIHRTNLQCAFIRAPIIEKTGNGVQVLARLEDRIIMVQQENILATTFHPELTGENGIHEYFVSLI